MYAVYYILYIPACGANYMYIYIQVYILVCLLPHLKDRMAERRCRDMEAISPACWSPLRMGSPDTTMSESWGKKCINNGENHYTVT